jgi:ABC-type glycerol-3-phosphate transport system substrate-binding protein
VTTIARRRLLAALPLVPALLGGCGSGGLLPWGAATATPAPQRRVRVVTTNKAGGVWSAAQVAAADRRLPVERRLSFEVLPFDPATPGVPPAVSSSFAVWPPVYAAMLGTLSGEAVPDLVLVDSRWVAACARADILTDLTPLLRTERWFDPDAYGGGVLGTGRVRGQQVALPLGLWAEALLYDGRAFATDGVPPPRPDWLWTDLLAAAQALTRRGRWGLALPRDTQSPGLLTLAWQHGASVVGRDGTSLSLAEPGLLEALRFLGDLVQRRGLARSPTPDPPTILESMAQREAAMVGASVGPPVWWRQPRFEGFALATWPAGERAQDQGGAFAYAPLMVGVPRGAARRDLAFEALGALAEAIPEGVPIPAGRRAAGAAPGVGDQMSAEDRAVMDRVRASARFLPGDFPYYAVAQAIEDELVVPVLTGRKKPEQAIADARPAMERRLAGLARPG